MRKHVRYTPALILVIFAAFTQTNAQNTSPYWSLAGNSNATSTSKLGTTNTQSLRIIAGNVQRMVVGYTSGNVSIGATTLDARLTVNAASGSNILLGQIGGTTKLRAGSNGGLSVGSGSTPPSNGLYVSGRVGLGTTSPSARLHIAGSSPYTTALQLTSGGIRVNNEWSTGDSSVGIYSEGGIGVQGNGMTGIYGSGMAGVFGTGYTGVYGEGSSSGSGVSGYSPEGDAVYGSSNEQAGVRGESANGYGGNFTSQNNWGLRASTTSGYYAGVFYGNVWTSGSYLPSDNNLKQDVQEFGDAMSLINKLKPRHYAYKRDDKYAFLNLPKGTRYGLMAQDVEEVLPSLVSTSNHEVTKPSTPRKPLKPGDLAKLAQQSVTEKPETISLKAVNYTELIPIVIKGMQEQQQQIEEQRQLITQQQQQIDDLKNLIKRLATDRSGTITTGTLSQATPNPASASTRISYALPGGTGRGQLLLTDAAGKTVKTVSLNSAGFVDVNTAGLSSGVYNYSLFINGKITDTKKLTVAR